MPLFRRKPPPPPTVEPDFREVLRVRVVHPDTATPEQLRDAFPGPADLQLRVVLDMPGSVAYADLAMLQDLGDPDELLTRAVANTVAEKAPLTQGGLPVERDGTTVAHGIFVLAETLYASGRILDLDRLLPAFDQVMDTPPWAHLVAVPFAEQLAVVPVLEPLTPELVATFRHFVAAGYDDSPNPLSPHTYLHRDGTLTVLPT